MKGTESCLPLVHEQIERVDELCKTKERDAGLEKESQESADVASHEKPLWHEKDL